MKNNYNILIIDESLDSYELYQRLLTSTDGEAFFTLSHATNSEQGFTRIAKFKPDCVLLDYALLDDLSALKRIRQDYSLLPIIVLADQDDEKFATHLLPVGVQDCIVKSQVHNDELLKQSILNAILTAPSNRSTFKKVRTALPKKSQIQILIIDNNSDDREFIKRSLTKVKTSNYVFIETESSLGLFKLIDQYSPQCVLLDYSLPGTDGLQVLNKITNYYPFIPIIIFSGQGNEYIAAEAIKKGAFHYLVKNEVTAKQLDATIKRGIDKKYLEKVVYEKNQEIRQYQYKSLERKNRFDRVVKATGIVVWEYDARKNKLFIAEQIVNLLGAPLEDQYISLEAWRKYIHADDLPEFDNHWYLGMETIENEYNLAYRIRTKNNAYIWIRETGNVLSRRDNHEPLEITGLYENINERKKNEETLNYFFSLTLESDKPLEQKINEVINLGLTYFKLDLGVVSRIDKKKYEVIYCQPQVSITPNQIYPIQDSYCSYLFGSNEIKSWHHLNDEKIHTHLLYKNQQQKAYIGTTIFVKKRPYGTLHFVSQTPRLKPFSNPEKVLLRLMAQWLSFELTRTAITKDVEESQNFLQLVQDSMPDLLFVKDEDFRIVRANPAFLNLYPEPVRHSVIGTTTIESYNDKEAEAFLAQDKLALKNGSSETEETINFPNGEIKTLLTKKVRFQNQDGNNFVLGVGRDITDSKKTLACLAESEERYELAIKGSSVGLWDWNIKTGKLFWSDRFKEIIGITDTQFKPNYEEFGRRLHPDDKEATEAAIFNHLESKIPYDVEYRLRKSDNTYVWVHARGQAVWNHNGEATRMAGSVDDISAKKTAEEEILRSNRELERFAYIASHDLQEPLRMVTNFTQLLKKYYEEQLDDRALEYIDYAVNGATRMQDLVKDLLSYARIGNEAENLQILDLNNLTPLIEENLLESIKQTNTLIRWQPLPTVLANPARLSSVFQNLIGNAIKYRKKDIAPEIIISVTTLGDFWVFDVKDNGMGMKQEYCHKIFEPFQRLHRKEEYSGTGMGLSICRKIVEELGGKIWAISKLGKGTTIKFSLPKLTPTNEVNNE